MCDSLIGQDKVLAPAIKANSLDHRLVDGIARLIIVLWSFRGILLSGCPAYPSTFGCLHVAWAEPINTGQIGRRTGSTAGRGKMERRPIKC